MRRLTIHPYFIVMTLLLFVSCSDYLSPEPQSFYTPENVYNNESGLRSLLITMRKNIKYDNAGGRNPIAMEYSISDLAIGKKTQNLRNVTPSNGPKYPFLDFFNEAYGFIKNTNVLLSRVEEIELDEETKNELIAKAYWYRAYWYYRLVNTYGDIPWIGKELKGPKLNFQTYSRSAILHRIQKDLEWAKKWVPNNISRKSEVTQAAVNHLLTKIYLANYEYEKAISAATDVIDGPHSLMRKRFGVDAENPKRNLQWDLHRWQNKNGPQNTEVIYATIDRPDGPSGSRSGGSYSMRNYVPSWWKVLDANGTRMCNWSKPAGDTLGIGNANVIPNNFFNLKIWGDNTYTWENTPDQRRADINWIEMKEIKGCFEDSPQFGEPYTKEFYGQLSDTSDSWIPWPYYKTFNKSPNNTRPVGGEADWYVFRLAETYLLRAEAYYWEDKLGLAAGDINEIRRRANAPQISAGDVTIDYIFDERARELYMEAPRHAEMTRVSYIMAHEGIDGYSMKNFSSNNWYYDRVMRYNDLYDISGAIWKGGQVTHIEPRFVLLPIPQSVIEANTKGRVNQNEGYVGAENNEPPIDSIGE